MILTKACKIGPFCFYLNYFPLQESMWCDNMSHNTSEHINHIFLICIHIFPQTEKCVHVSSLPNMKNAVTSISKARCSYSHIAYMGMCVTYIKCTACGLQVCIHRGYRPGGTHILRHRGMCRSKGPLFHKKSLNMGAKISLKMGLFSQIFGCSPSKHMKIVKNWPIFWEKSLKMGNFSAKITHKNG